MNKRHSLGVIRDRPGVIGIDTRSMDPGDSDRRGGAGLTTPWLYCLVRAAAAGV